MAASIGWRTLSGYCVLLDIRCNPQAYWEAINTHQKSISASIRGMSRYGGTSRIHC